MRSPLDLREKLLVFDSLSIGRLHLFHLRLNGVMILKRLYVFFYFIQVPLKLLRLLPILVDSLLFHLLVKVFDGIVFGGPDQEESRC